MGKIGRLSFINSFVDNVQKTQKEAQDISMKKAEHAQRMEEFKLKNKIYSDKIKLQQAQGQITSLDADKALMEFKDYSKMIDSKAKVEANMIGHAEGQNMAKQKELQSVATQLMPYIKTKTDSKGTTIERGYTTKPVSAKSGEKVSKIDQILGDIENNGFYGKDNDFVEFESRKEAEHYANSQLGAGFKDKYPQTVQILNKKYGPDAKDLPIDKFKKSPNPLRSAFDYLVNEVGMEEEAARKYLKENN